jgi:hypothetical protein
MCSVHVVVVVFVVVVVVLSLNYSPAHLATILVIWHLNVLLHRFIVSFCALQGDGKKRASGLGRKKRGRTHRISI